jgi:hypothetical protein
LKIENVGVFKLPFENIGNTGHFERSEESVPQPLLPVALSERGVAGGQ